MAKLRKVKIKNNKEGRCIVILSDAYSERIASWLRTYGALEDGSGICNYLHRASVGSGNYFKVLWGKSFDEYDNPELADIVGYDETFEF